MTLSILILSFTAWMLSILAPCILPVLPVILGWTLGSQRWYKPLIIVWSAALFITLFTFLLRVSTSLINIPQWVWWTISGVIILMYGLTLAFPHKREELSFKLGLYKTNNLTVKAQEQWWMLWDIMLWASLWPIFASCSPTYALLLSTVFPNSIIQWLRYTLAYSLWFGLALLVVAYAWRSVVIYLSWAANPGWRFKKSLWRLLILTWILVVTWWMRVLETTLLNAWRFGAISVEQNLIDDMVK